MFEAAQIRQAQQLLDEARAKGLRIAIAESCTGGLIAALLTEIPGSSDVVERGFVTYSNESKEDLLGVPTDLIRQYGAVSAPVAQAMVQGALQHSLAHLAVAVTGIAGPGGGTAQKPVGLVYVAALKQGGEVMLKAFNFGSLGRTEIRSRTAGEALALLRDLI